MKKQVQTGLMLAMIILSANAFGQTNGLGSAKIKYDETAANTHLDLLLNLVGTNINYGKSGTALTDNSKQVLGAQLGLSLQAGITPKLSLVSELYFIMKGGKLVADKLLNINKTTLRLYTVESPLLARFNIGRLYVNAGPSIAYNFYGTRKLEDASAALKFNSSNEGFKRWDAGIQMGAGYRFTIKQKAVVLDARYSYGLTNISYGQEMYNRYLNVSVHFSNLWSAKPAAERRN